MEINFDKGSGPKLKRCDLNDCEALCCYDGVYLHESEELLIRETIKRYPDHFMDLPPVPIIDGNWMGKVKGRKTATVKYISKKDKPKHFTDTRCIFVTPDHKCSLQILANEIGVHPWTFKPSACWLFPMHLNKGELISPPKNGEKDPFDFGNIYPGFVKYTPCGKDCDDGKKWHSVLEDEIKYLLNISKIPVWDLETISFDEILDAAKLIPFS